MGKSRSPCKTCGRLTAFVVCGPCVVAARKPPKSRWESRFESYQAEYGTSSWELDALEPELIAELIRNELEGLIDPDAWQVQAERQQAARDALQDVADRWEEIVS